MKVLPFPAKIYPFEIFTRATPGSSLVSSINACVRNRCVDFCLSKNGFCINWIVRVKFRYELCFKFAGITYAGNHGLDIVHEDGSTFVHPMPSEYKTKLDKLHEVLKAEVCHDGAWVEDKGTLLCFHFRSEHCQYFLWLNDH